MTYVGRAGRWSRGMLGLLTLALLLLLLAGTASAALVEPEVVRGSPTCGDYSANGTEFNIFGNERFQVEDSGLYTDGTLQVNVIFYDTPEGQEFDWSANLDIDVIVAKGGSLASIYRYDPPVKSDESLHSPFNDTRSLWYPSTYISFCYNASVKPVSGTTTTLGAPTTQPSIATTQPSMATTTTEAPGVLPTVATTIKSAVVTTSIPTEVKGTEILPYTGMSDDTLWVLGLGLLAAGATAVWSARGSRRDD